MPPTTRRRTAYEIVDQAIAENRLGEWVLYALAVGVACVGCFVLVRATVDGQPVQALAGAAATYLVWPAMRMARRTRKESIALRLLEAPLSRADTAKEAAAMLRVFFDQVMRDGRERPAEAAVQAVVVGGRGDVQR